MFERSWTVAVAPNSPAGVVTIDEIALPADGKELELEAWFGGLAASNCYIFEGDVDANSAANRISKTTEFDCLLTVPYGGVGCVKIPRDIAQRLTLYFDTQSANPQAVTVRIKECYELRHERTRNNY